MNSTTRELRADAQASRATPPHLSARIAERRTKVLRLLARRCSAREITTVLANVSERTVRADIAALREEGRTALREKTTLTYAADIVLENDEVKRVLWSIIQRPDTDARTRVAAASAIRASSDSERAALQDLGVVWKRPLEVQIRERMLEQFASKPVAALLRIADARTDADFKSAITDAFGADAAAQFLLPSGEVAAAGEVSPAGEETPIGEGAAGEAAA